MIWMEQLVLVIPSSNQSTFHQSLSLFWNSSRGRIFPWNYFLSFFLSSFSSSFPPRFLLHLFPTLLLCVFHSSVHHFSECNFSCALINVKIKNRCFFLSPVHVIRGYLMTLLSFRRYPFIWKIATCQNPGNPFSFSICFLLRSRVESLTTICSRGIKSHSGSNASSAILLLSNI